MGRVSDFFKTRHPEQAKLVLALSKDLFTIPLVPKLHIGTHPVR